MRFFFQLLHRPADIFTAIPYQKGIGDEVSDSLLCAAILRHLGYFSLFVEACFASSTWCTFGSLKWEEQV